MFHFNNNRIVFSALSLFIIMSVVLSAVFISGCIDSELKAQNGDTVSVDYTGKYQNGTVFDTSDGKTPLTFILGAEQMIPGFENAVRGMKVGEEKTVTLPPEEAYGNRSEDKIQPMALEKFKEAGIEPVVGDTYGFPPVKVVRIEGDQVYLDFNHPLAGETLIFDIKLIELTPKEKEKEENKTDE